MADQKDIALGELAIESGYLIQAELDEALRVQKKIRDEMGMDQPLIQVLVSKKFLTLDQAQEVRHAAAIKSGEASIVAGYQIVTAVNGSRRIAARLSSALGFLVLTAHAAEASRFRPSFDVAWKQAAVIVVGRLGEPNTMRPGSITYAGRTVGTRVPTAAYPLDARKFFRGSQPPDKRMFVIDYHYRSTASLRVLPNATYLLFVKEESLDAHPRKKLGTGENATYKCILELPWNAETEPELRGAIQGLQAYRRLKTRDEKVRFLLSQLEKPNRHLSDLVQGQICTLKVKEAIPHYEKLLSAEPERTRLDAVWVLRAVGHERADEILVGWLRDPGFKSKVDAIIQLARHKGRSAIPDIRKCAGSRDERIRAEAGAALVRLGEPDGKKLLFDVLTTGTDRTARWNAIHTLNWNYSGAFTDEEKLALERLLKDKDESIRRVAGFVLEKIAERRSALPDIRKRAESDDEYVRARAGADLVRFGEPDGKRVLFDILATGTHGTARETAMRTIHQYYKGGFTGKERATLRKLVGDKDESVRRTAGYILGEIAKGRR